MEAGRLSPSVLHQLQLLHIHTGFARQFLCGNGAEAEAEAEAAAAAMAMAAANAVGADAAAAAAAAAAAQAQTQAAGVTSAATSSASSSGAGFPVFPAMHARLFSESAQFGSFSPPVVTLSQAEAMEQHLTHLSLSGGNHGGELVTRPCRTAVVWDDTGLHQTSEDVDDSESQAQELAWMMEQQVSLKSGSSPPMYIF